MKNSRTNSFRLHRISRANSLKKQSQTFYLSSDDPIKFHESVKIPALNSVSRGIKHNELSFITGDDLNKLRVEPLQKNDHFYQSAHLSLAETRKKFDEMKKQRDCSDQNITKLKAQIKKYKTIEKQYQDKIDEAKSQAQKLEYNLKSKKLQLQQAEWQKTVLQNMRKRLKWDKVVYDQRKFNLQKEYSFQNKQKSLLKRDEYYVGEETDRAQKIFDKFCSQYNAEKTERQQHIRNLQAMRQQKQRCNQNNIAREHQIYEIAERALQDKDPSEKQWHQIYLTHVFVSKMLRNKIDRQMDKFSVVQFAFKTIKTATGVSDAKTLINKFLNKQVEYGGLLGKITSNDKRITELKQQRDFLLQEQKQLQMEKQTLQNVKFKNLDISSQLKNYEVVSHHERKMETYLSKMSIWLSKQTKKINAIEKTSINYKQLKNKETIKNNFIEYCQLVSNLLAKCQKVEAEDIPTPSELSARDTSRVARIQPKRSRKNSGGQQIFDVEQQELPALNQHEQKEMINAQREELIKTNQRFMKDARKRLEQRRKNNLEKVVQKKDTKKVQIKKEED